MTDQQTSRTNITEALPPAYRSIVKALTYPCSEPIHQEAAKALAALAAEPRSDAVTAPDEPSHEHEWGLCYGGLSPEAAAEHGIKPHWFCTDCMFGDEPPVEARAASASVPPLAPTPIEVEAWVAGYLAGREDDMWRTDDEIAERAVDATCAVRMDALAAETPEQGR